MNGEKGNDLLGEFHGTVYLENIGWHKKEKEIKKTKRLYLT